MMTNLTTDYRPQSFDEVVGQDSTVKSLSTTLKKGGMFSYLFTGPSGCGKTTLARIIAAVKKLEVVEIDAATHTGIDAMRAIKESLRFSVLGGKKAGRIVIIDECHSLSKQAWQSLLKDVEDPPRGVWWAFCTTEAHKVPKTIMTRCAVYKLDFVDEEELYDLGARVNEAESLRCSKDVLSVVAKRAEGSPRALLSGLSKVQGMKSRKEAAALLEAVEEDDEVIALCRLMMKGAPWPQVMKAVEKCGKINPEGARRQIFAYFTKVAQGSKKYPGNALAVLDAFGEVYPDDAIGHLILSLGDWMGGSDDA